MTGLMQSALGISRNVAEMMVSVAASAVPSVDTALLLGGCLAIVGGVYGYDPRLASVTFGVLCLTALHIRRSGGRQA